MSSSSTLTGLDMKLIRSSTRMRHIQECTRRRSMAARYACSFMISIRFLVKGVRVRADKWDQTNLITFNVFMGDKHLLCVAGSFDSPQASPRFRLWIQDWGNWLKWFAFSSQQMNQRDDQDPLLNMVCYSSVAKVLQRICNSV